MAELMFGMGQTKKKKAVENKVREDKSKEWNYQGKGMNGLETMRKEQHDRDEGWKQAQRDTKANLKDVQGKGMNGLETMRKEQHDRDQNWKETGRNQIKENTNFDMARAIFK